MLRGAVATFSPIGPFGHFELPLMPIAKLGKMQQRFMRAGWTSTGTATGVVHHEIGHALTFGAASEPQQAGNALKSWAKLKISARRGQLGTPEDLRRLARRVSQYAATSPAEFVAETFAGLVNGAEYDAEVLQLYRQLGGPVAPSWRAAFRRAAREAEAVPKVALPAARGSEGEGFVAPLSRIKQQRAKASYKASTRRKQRLAEGQEPIIAKQIGARLPTESNFAVDVILDLPGKREVGIEVKTLVDQKNHKITMHPDSRRRKLAWKAERPGKRALVTVIVDKRPKRLYSGHPYYIRHGVGSFRLKNVQPVEKLSDLLRFILQGLEF
jgi:hypothetical protein